MYLLQYNIGEEPDKQCNASRSASSTAANDAAGCSQVLKMGIVFKMFTRYKSSNYIEKRRRGRGGGARYLNFQLSQKCPGVFLRGLGTYVEAASWFWEVVEACKWLFVSALWFSWFSWLFVVFVVIRSFRRAR